MASHEDEEDDDPFILSASRSIGPVRRRVYDPNPKHGWAERGRIARRPRNGQDALDYSIPVWTSTEVRMGIDYQEGVFVVLRYHDGGPFRDRPWDDCFHGYVVPWHGLTQK